MGEAMITRRGGKPPAPTIFGNGSDGDLMIAAGQTVVLPVPVPHQSMVERNYRSITIAAGGTLKLADQNAGLVLRCRGDCNIYGTIDQAMKSPKPNPGTNYRYPPELKCGNGGTGGNNGRVVTGGKGMLAHICGGGWSGGGTGAGFAPGYVASAGGSVDTIDITDTMQFFVGGKVNGPDHTRAGTYGGGGSGAAGGYGWVSSDGASGAGSPGKPPTENGIVAPAFSSGGGSGAAGNIGGGVVLLYVGGLLKIDGNILCNGGNGGAIPYVVRDANAAFTGTPGGGAGGGAIYILYNQTIAHTGNLNANGGKAGTVVTSTPITLGTAGGIGSVTIKKYERGMIL